MPISTDSHSSSAAKSNDHQSDLNDIHHDSDQSKTSRDVDVKSVHAGKSDLGLANSDKSNADSDVQLPGKLYLGLAWLSTHVSFVVNVLNHKHYTVVCYILHGWLMWVRNLCIRTGLHKYWNCFHIPRCIHVILHSCNIIHLLGWQHPSCSVQCMAGHINCYAQLAVLLNRNSTMCIVHEIITAQQHIQHMTTQVATITMPSRMYPGVVNQNMYQYNIGVMFLLTYLCRTWHSDVDIRGLTDRGYEWSSWAGVELLLF